MQGLSMIFNVEASSEKGQKEEEQLCCILSIIRTEHGVLVQSSNVADAEVITICQDTN